MHVRPIKDKDIKQCLDIYNYYIENTTYTFEEEQLSLESFTQRVKSISKKHPFLVFVANDIVIGYAYLDYFSNRSAYRYTVDLSIYLDKDLIHKGLGCLLLDEIELYAKEFGYKNIISIITSENISSIKFHEKYGYKKVGELKDVGYKFNRELSVIYYQKSL